MVVGVVEVKGTYVKQWRVMILQKQIYLLTNLIQSFS